MESNRFRFLTVVWGPAYTDAFLNVCVRSLLAPANLPVFTRYTESTYTIYTTQRDIERFRSSDIFGRLAGLMKVEFGVIQANPWLDKYNLMTHCHAHGIRSAQHEDCGFFIMSPDVVWSNSSFSRLLEISQTPTPLVAMATMPRVVKESFLPDYFNQLGSDDALPARELVSLSLRHLHPVTISQFWDEPLRTGAGPGDFLWRLGDEGLLVRAFQLQPVLIRPVNRDAVPEIAFDADYPLKACPNPADVLVIHDSDDVHCVDFTNRNTPDLILPGYETIEGTVRWAVANTNQLHRELVRHSVRVHSRDLSEAWVAADRRADEVIREILTRLEKVGARGALRASPFRYLSLRFLVTKWREYGTKKFFLLTLARAVAPVVRLLGLDRVRVTTTPA